MTARLSLFDSPDDQSPWAEHDLTQSDYQRPLANAQLYEPSPWADHVTNRSQFQSSTVDPHSADPSVTLTGKSPLLIHLFRLDFIYLWFQVLSDLEKKVKQLLYS